MSPRRSIPCALVRAGTSKGVFLRGVDLPPKGPSRDRFIKALMGTPDPRQIDGLGGGDILTSKVAILDPPSRSDADVDYTFAQVGVQQDLINYDGICGNISAAVGPMAIEAGLVRPVEPWCRVRIHATSVNKVIEAEVPVREGRPLSEGDFRVDGVPGRGARILLDFAGAAGSRTGKLLPTGEEIDRVEVPGFGVLDVSLVDLGNPVIFVKAGDFGLTGTESPSEIDANRSLIDRCETIRGIGAAKLGFVADYRLAREESPFVPFLCLVGKAVSYPRFGNGKIVGEDEIDLTVRLIGIDKRVHRTFPGTGAACLAVAAGIPGTLVHELMKSPPGVESILHLGHPSGVMGVETRTDPAGHPERVVIATTWRKIMEGHAFIPPEEHQG